MNDYMPLCGRMQVKIWGAKQKNPRKNKKELTRQTSCRVSSVVFQIQVS
jgi:hypothetical protein